MKGKPNHTKTEGVPRLTETTVLDDLGFSAAEVLEIQVKADIYRDLMSFIRAQGFTQHALGAALGIHQPDVSDLLNGRVSKFSVARLIKFAGRLNLGARVTLTLPDGSGMDISASTAPSQRTVGATS
jgi:predicted XRE-type DNA-binding protein